MLKKIALIAILFALPLGVMAQSKFGHMNSQEIITVMPEFTKAQADLEALSKQYQDEMQRGQEELNKKYQELLQQQDSLPRNILERRQKEVQDNGSTSGAIPTGSLQHHAAEATGSHGSHLQKAGRSHSGCR